MNNSFLKINITSCYKIDLSIFISPTHTRLLKFYLHGFENEKYLRAKEGKFGHLIEGSE